MFHVASYGIVQRDLKEQRGTIKPIDRSGLWLYSRDEGVVSGDRVWRRVLESGVVDVQEHLSLITAGSSKHSSRSDLVKGRRSFVRDWQ